MKNWFSSFSSKDSGTSRYSVFYGIIIGGLLVSLAWMLVPDLGSSGTSAALTGPGSSTTHKAHATRSGADQRLDRCRQVYAAQQQPVHAAASAMDQWQVHIDAMNKLVAGDITLQQANQFWNNTRVGAQARLRAFDTADASLNRQTVRCPAPGGRSTPRQLRRCERAVAANRRVLQQAGAALATWGHHVKDMEMLRMGQMSPTQATQMWMQKWHQGQGQVTRYRAAVDATHGLHC